MMKKRGISVALAVVMMLGALGGCARDKETVQNNDKEKLTFSVSLPDSGNQYVIRSQNINEDEWVKKFNEKFNTNVTFMHRDSKRDNEEMQMMFASGEIADVILAYGDCRTKLYAEAIENGAFMKLNDILEDNKEELSELLNTIPERAWNESKNADGDIFGIPVNFKEDGSSKATYIRKDLLDKYNLEIPDTIDDFVNVMRVFKENGMKYPYCAREGWSYSELFISCFGVAADRFNLNENGEMVPDIVTDRFKNAMAFNRKLCEEGLINPESLTINSTEWANKIKTGEIGMFIHDASNLEAWNSQLKVNLPEAEYILIPSPLGYNGERGATVNAAITSTLFVNSSFKQAKELMLFLNEQCKEENVKFIRSESKKEITDAQEATELQLAKRDFIGSTLFVINGGYNTDLAEGDTSYAQNYRDWYENIREKEGYHAYKIQDIPCLEKYPELKPGYNNALLMEYTTKIFTGEWPIEKYDEFIETYMKRGGDELIKEATQMYKNGEVFRY